MCVVSVDHQEVLLLRDCVSLSLSQVREVVVFLPPRVGGGQLIIHSGRKYSFIIFYLLNFNVSLIDEVRFESSLSIIGEKIPCCERMCECILCIYFSLSLSLPPSSRKKWMTEILLTIKNNYYP